MSTETMMIAGLKWKVEFGCYVVELGGWLAIDIQNLGGTYVANLGSTYVATVGDTNLKDEFDNIEVAAAAAIVKARQMLNKALADLEVK